MRELPSASNTQHRQLYHRPPNYTGVGSLRLISELGLTFLKIETPSAPKLHPVRTTPQKQRETHPLKHLLPPDILQPSIEVLDLLHQILHFTLIRALDGARLADRQVEVELDLPAGNTVAQPATSGPGVRRREADAVVAAVGGGECEAAFCGAALVDDAVVVVKGLVNGDLDADAGRGFEAVRLRV